MELEVFYTVVRPVGTLLIMMIFVSSVGMVLFHRLPLRFYRISVLLSGVGAVVLWGYLTFVVHLIH